MNFYEHICGQTELGYKRLCDRFESSVYFDGISNILGREANKGLSKTTIICMDKVPPKVGNENIIFIHSSVDVIDYTGWTFDMILNEIVLYLRGQGFRVWKNPVGENRVDLQITWRSPDSKKENKNNDAV